MNQFLMFLLLHFLMSGIASANGEHEIVHFERELYAPQMLNHFGIGKDRFKSLTPEQKNDLQEARKILASFLIALQSPNSDVSEFLAQEFRERYKSRKELLSELIDLETEILVNAVTDFEIQQNDTIILKHYVVLFSEGMLIVKEESVRFKKYEAGLKIESIGGLQ